ncbi:MAG: hypothetical protein ACYSWU_12310 [Planctomycetota bacterium]|jgi:hypothetical protein
MKGLWIPLVAVIVLVAADHSCGAVPAASAGWTYTATTGWTYVAPVYPAPAVYYPAPAPPAYVYRPPVVTVYPVIRPAPVVIRPAPVVIRPRVIAPRPVLRRRVWRVWQQAQGPGRREGWPLASGATGSLSTGAEGTVGPATSGSRH